ncbi:hypothetical protein GCM10022223_47170 [Kineosporia mesophila]|uniref:Secreted protein n=1 Tax=Kineosporia mesophila TaxID=566012 RepID=A0ABP7A478_9ACTN
MSRNRPASPFVLVGSAGMWAADCLSPGCLWTTTTSDPECADQQALSHTTHVHPEVL